MKYWLGELNRLSAPGLLHPMDPKKTMALPGAVRGNIESGATGCGNGASMEEYKLG